MPLALSSERYICQADSVDALLKLKINHRRSRARARARARTRVREAHVARARTRDARTHMAGNRSPREGAATFRSRISRSSKRVSHSSRVPARLISARRSYAIVFHVASESPLARPKGIASLTKRFENDARGNRRRLQPISGASFPADSRVKSRRLGYLGY